MANASACVQSYVMICYRCCSKTNENKLAIQSQYFSSRILFIFPFPVFSSLHIYCRPWKSEKTSNNFKGKRRQKHQVMDWNECDAVNRMAPFMTIISMKPFFGNGSEGVLKLQIKGSHWIGFQWANPKFANTTNILIMSRACFFPFIPISCFSLSHSPTHNYYHHMYTQLNQFWLASNKVWTFWMWQSLLHQLCCKQTQCFERHVKCYATTKMVMPKRWTRESVFGVSHNLRKITHSLTQYRI